ncbi:MAG TPA: alpha/beta hydrolase [Gaiellales bacterium]|jgi:pimeloyl-ACP methyl ester carboxylesterase|nr:alpha/beta hydrolase [Gaiellales bacterium]
MTAETRYVETPDGRTLRVEVAGDGERVVVAHVGTPNAGVLYEPWIEDAAGRGLTLLTYDRPGYGGSTRLDGRSVADCADDVHAIGRALGFERCVVWGFSGGGPHALACAALLPHLVVAAASIGAMAPPDAAGFDFLETMEGANRKDIELLRADRELWERRARSDRDEMLAMTAADLAEAWSEGISPGDGELLHGPFGAWLHRSIRVGIEPTADGWIDDSLAFDSPWGIDPAAIAVPVKVWHGEDDRFVPVEHGRWLAARIPGAEADLRDGDGHLGVAALRIGDVHEWLARHAWPTA